MTMDAKHEFRVTFPDCYRGNCPGATTLGARQGYYQDADNPEAAARGASKLFPGAKNRERMDVQPWGASARAAFPEKSYRVVIQGA